MNNQTMTFTPEQLRKQAQEMLRQAEQLEKTGVTKDAIRRDMVPALRELMQAKHRVQKQWMSWWIVWRSWKPKLESLKSWCRRYCADA